MNVWCIAAWRPAQRVQLWMAGSKIFPASGHQRHGQTGAYLAINHSTIGWIGLSIMIYIALTLFQSYRHLEAGDILLISRNITSTHSHGRASGFEPPTYQHVFDKLFSIMVPSHWTRYRIRHVVCPHNVTDIFPLFREAVSMSHHCPWSWTALTNGLVVCTWHLWFGFNWPIQSQIKTALSLHYGHKKPPLWQMDSYTNKIWPC